MYTHGSTHTNTATSCMHSRTIYGLPLGKGPVSLRTGKETHPGCTEEIQQVVREGREDRIEGGHTQICRKVALNPRCPGSKFFTLSFDSYIPLYYH